MKRNQVEKAFDKFEESDEPTRAYVFLDMTDTYGKTVKIVVEAGEYDLFMEDELLVTHYDHREGEGNPPWETPGRRYVGGCYIPFDAIKSVELVAEVEE